MLDVRDCFNQEIFIGTLVAVSTNSGMYAGRVTKFNVITSLGIPKLSSVQVQLTSGKKRSYDIPHIRMINLDEVHNAVRKYGI